MQLNYQISQTVNSVYAILCLGTYPGSEIWIKGTAKLTKALLHCYDPTTNFIIYRVCKAATTDVVVLNAAIIFPAFSLA